MPHRLNPLLERIASQRARERDRLLPVLQASLAAGSAWGLAHDLVGHPMPIFAPVAALSILTNVPGRRTTRVAAATLGSLIGVAVGDLVVAGVGTGGAQVAVVTLLVMALATLAGARPAVVTNAGIAALLIATIQAPHGLWSDAGGRRLLDVLVGGSAAMLVSVLIPAPPLRGTRSAAERVLTEFWLVLDDIGAALRAGDPAACERSLDRARALDVPLLRLRNTVELASETIRLSPHLRSAREPVQAVAARLVPLELAVRNTRVLARDALRVIEIDPDSATALSRDVAVLADALRRASAPADRFGSLPVIFAAARGEAEGDGAGGSDGRSADGVDGMLKAAAGATAVAEAHGSLPAMAMAAQIRATVSDLLQVGGSERGQAVSRVRAAVAAGAPASPAGGHLDG